MDPISIGFLAFAGLFVLLLASVPIGFAMGICGLLGTSAIIGFQPALSLLGTTALEKTVTYDLSIIP